MEAVFLLWHVHEAEEGSEDSKLIGVYRTDEDAHAAIRRLRNQPGFRSFPKGFNIERYELNKDHWTEGFLSAVSQPDGTAAASRRCRKAARPKPRTASGN
jgi:hypothetical protein